MLCRLLLYYYAFDISSPKLKSLCYSKHFSKIGQDGGAKFRPTNIEKHLILTPRIQTFIIAFTTLWTYSVQKLNSQLECLFCLISVIVGRTVML